jgi:hypothetical protein
LEYKTAMSNCEESDLKAWLRATENQRDEAYAEIRELRDMLRHIIAKAEFHDWGRGLSSLRDTMKEVEKVLENNNER